MYVVKNALRQTYNFSNQCLTEKTSRDRPKSAPYPRLKNSKRTSKFQSILFYSTKTFFEKSLTTPKKIERGTLWDISIPSLSQNPKKMKGGPFGKFFFPKKVSQCQKKLKGGTLWSRPAVYVMRETFWFCSLGQQMKFEIL